MGYKATNNAYSTLASPITTLTETTIYVQTGHGDRFPVIAAPDFTFLTIESATAREIVKVVSRNAGSDSMTVVRHAEDAGPGNTSAKTWLANDLVELRPCAAVLTGMLQSSDATATYAPLASPTFTGTPTAPTPADNTTPTRLATTGYVESRVGTLGSMASQNFNAVSITGGSATGLSSVSATTCTATTGTFGGNVVGSNATGTKTISTAAPSAGGANGDVWYQV